MKIKQGYEKICMQSRMKLKEMKKKIKEHVRKKWNKKTNHEIWLIRKIWKRIGGR